MKIDYSNKTVLIIDGLQRVGIASAKAFASLGAQTVLTSHCVHFNEEKLYEHFTDLDFCKPIVIRADVTDKDERERLFGSLKQKFNKIDILIINTGMTQIISGLDCYDLNALKESLSYSSWPLYSCTQEIKDAFGHYPRYVIGMSSTAPDHYSAGLDYVALSNKVLEVMCQYMTYRLSDKEVSINILRSRAISIPSYEEDFNKEYIEYISDFVPHNHWIEPEEAAKVAVALTSGYMDFVQGQIINVDRGMRFFDNSRELHNKKRQHSSFS